MVEQGVSLGCIYVIRNINVEDLWSSFHVVVKLGC